MENNWIDPSKLVFDEKYEDVVNNYNLFYKALFLGAYDFYANHYLYYNQDLDDEHVCRLSNIFCIKYAWKLFHDKSLPYEQGLCDEIDLITKFDKQDIISVDGFNGYLRLWIITFDDGDQVMCYDAGNGWWQVMSELLHHNSNTLPHFNLKGI